MKAFVHVCGAVALCAGSAHSQLMIDPYYSCAYEYSDLGAPAGVPQLLGGLVFKDGDPDTLLIGGAANGGAGAIYQIAVVRDAESHVIGFSGAGTQFAPASYIDGGLCYGPDGVLFYSRYSMNHIGQILPGQTSTARDDDLYALGFSGSVGAFMLVPPGSPGAGRFKIFPYNSSVWHDATLSPDGNGTFQISAPTNSIPLGGGPEGIVYIEAGASLFPNGGVLISEYGSGAVTSYEIDANGDPVPGTRRLFLTGLSGAEGGTRDPVSGDFLFSTFGGVGRVVVVRGFTPDCDVRANLNRDCALNFFDVQLFLQAFAAGDDMGDFNDDGVFNFFDAQAFLANFAQGCN
ncbi:MAG: hypothetical protein DYG94_05965 [Leptolyngbya sp. PLA3]|nr:MAG: hypothetical protein EDM82_03605 [Cyanobacteria bacterium CYA]MCE7968274.1 hypothetical protein [Leptolyngbya sp. PL-A3]